MLQDTHKANRSTKGHPQSLHRITYAAAVAARYLHGFSEQHKFAACSEEW
jgi:hypothetical protein